MKVNDASLFASRSDTFSKKRIEGSLPTIGATGPLTYVAPAGSTTR